MLCRSEGQFSETAPKKTAEHTVQHCGGCVGSVVASHCGGGESLVVVTTLGAVWLSTDRAMLLML